MAKTPMFKFTGALDAMGVTHTLKAKDADTITVTIQSDGANLDFHFGDDGLFRGMDVMVSE